MVGLHQQKIRPATVENELRHIHAALAVAKRWKYLAEVPAIPEILSDQREKLHVTEEHFALTMKAANVATFPDMQIHDRPFLEKICGGDVAAALLEPRPRTLYREFKRIQESVADDEGNRLIDLPCQDAGNTDHTCNEWCHVYGVHAFRYAHARVNWANPQLQNQMGHPRPGDHRAPPPMGGTTVHRVRRDVAEAGR